MIFAYLGKGGVGKSTLAVETAFCLKSLGSVVCIGLDQQHNHRDIIEIEHYDIPYVCLSPKVTQFVEYVLENTPMKAFKESAPIIASDFISVLNLAEVYSEVINKYQYIVVDFPPNHSGLKMLQFPGILDNMIYKALTLKERIRKMVKGSSDVLDKIEYLVKIGDLLKKEIYSFYWIPVGIPTELGYLEACRSYNDLKRLSLKVHKIVCNMVYPIPEYECALCNAIYNSHNQYLAQYNQYFQKEGKEVVQIPFTFEREEIREVIRNELLTL